MPSAAWLMSATMTSMPVSEDQIYARIGDAGFARLVAAFYRQVPTDDILGPLYPPDDWANAEWRLREFLVGRFGGTKLRCN